MRMKIKRRSMRMRMRMGRKDLEAPGVAGQDVGQGGVRKGIADGAATYRAVLLALEPALEE